MMGKISNWFEDRLINLSEGLLWLFTVSALLGVLGGLAIAVIGQAVVWLQHGYIPVRDGFWLFALAECGESWCRPEGLTLTDWVGFNRIISWILDLHVVFYCVFIGFFAFGAIMAWANYNVQWKALEAKLRSSLSRPEDSDD